MGFVIEGVFALGLVLLLLWAWSLRGSVTRDAAEERERRKREAEEERRKKREARLYRKGEPLRCLGCEATFLGPMPAAGCPQCHLAALVVTEADYRKGRQAAEAAAHRQEGE